MHMLDREQMRKQTNALKIPGTTTTKQKRQRKRRHFDTREGQDHPRTEGREYRANPK